MFNDIFGGMFDFNGDGHTDFFEEATGFAIMDEQSKEEETDDLDFNENSDDWGF